MKTRQGAGACPQTGTQISKSTELFNQQHGASSLALGIQSQFKSNKSKISIKIETVFGFSQGTKNRSSREISKIEGGEGIIAVVKMSLTRPLLASSQKDAPIGLNEVGMTVMLRSKCPLTCFTGSCWKWGVETEKMLARLAFAQCWKLVISFHDLDPSLEKVCNQLRLPPLSLFERLFRRHFQAMRSNKDDLPVEYHYNLWLNHMTRGELSEIEL